MPRVMLVDPYVMTKEGIKRVLSHSREFEICLDVNTKEECLVMLQKSKPDLIIMESNLRKMDAKEFIREIKAKNKEVKILVYSYNDSIDQVLKMLECGVNGYLSKICTIDEFLKGINMILKQGRYIQDSISVKMKMQNNRKGSERNKASFLTKREMEVLVLVTKGHLNKEIATTLNITERTVKNHLFSIFRKLEVSDRTQAAVFALKNNLVKS